MQKELHLWKFIADKLSQKEIVMLLTVAESSGSSPGRQGFKMAICEDELFGSIGGGVMEVRLVELAKLKIKKAKGKNKSEIVEQVHQKNSPDASGMICSGKQSVVIMMLSENDLENVGKIASDLSGKNEAFIKMSEEGLAIEEDTSQDAGFIRLDEEEFIYREKLGFENKLYIIGGGHCALALSEIMAKLDFHISLFDDRPNLNTIEKNQFAHNIQIIEDYEKLRDLIPAGEKTYVVTMTLGYKSDEIAIKSLFDKDFAYFGVMGSKAKMKTMLRKLEDEGFDKERLGQIHTPIGLPIDSKTPEEIAISIAAEIIATKNK